MNIFDAHISGSLSVSSSAEIQGDLTVLGIINATISGNTTSADTASFAPNYTLTSSFYAYSGTTNGRLTAIETSTASLNTFTSSTDSRLNSIEGVTGSISSLNTYTGSNNTVIGTLQTSTASLNTFTSSASDRLVALETSTGSINTYTSSNTTNINAIHTSTASLNTYTGSNNTIIGTLQTSTGSLNTYTSSNTTNINAIHTATASLNSFSSSADGRLTSIEGVTGSIAALNTYTGSNNTAINALNSYTSSNTTNINAIHTATASLNSYTGSNNTVIGTLQTASSSLNSYTSSNTTNINAIHTATSSLNSFTSSASGRLTALETASSSLNSYTSSNTTAITALNTSTSSLNSFTTSFNTAFGLSGANVTVKGNLTVQGSTTQVDSTTVNIGDNIIQLNGTGATNAGIVVRDATSPTFTSGSFLWDSTNDKWVAGPLGSEDEVVLKTASQALTNKTISGGSNTLSNIGNSSLTNSSITIAGTSTSLGGSITATTILTSTGVWSGSAQLPAGVVSGSAQVVASLPAGTVSGSSQVLSGTGIWSGSAQLPSGVVSGSSQVLNGSGVWSGSAQLPSGVVSGSSQVSYTGLSNIPAGIVSGSSQITFLSISSIPSGLVSGSSQVLAGTGIWSGSAQLPSGVVSGSSQVLNGTTIHSGAFFNGISVVSGSGQISFNGITDKPTLVSGSSQITYGSLSGIPSGIVSGSSQITFGSISGIPSGLVSGSSQVLAGTGIWSGSAQLPSGVVSGSSQISFGSISGVPSGLVSGSSQITGIGNSQLTNSSFYIGTTSISLGRSSASQTLTGVSIDGNAATVSNLTAVQLYNNMGEGHSTRTSFDASTPSYGFGYRFVQGSTNGPGTGGSQFYSWYIGLGDQYPSTGAGSYGAMFAVDRNSTTPYLSVRYNENNGFTSWRKMYAGYADSAGSVSGANVSGNISGNASNITSYTINQNVGSSNTPTFAGVNLTDRLYLNAGSYEGSILFGSSTTWRCGIRQHDDADAELRIWTVNNSGMIFLANGYNGEPADISRPTDGLVVVSNNVGIGNFSAADPSYKLHVKGSAGLEGNLVLNNGGYGWIYANDTNHSIIMRGDRNGTAADYTNYYQYGGSIASGKGHKFWTGGVLASQTLKFHIGDDYTYNTGNMTIGGTLTENSSIRYKKDIENITYGLDKVLQLRGVTYVKKENNVKEMGVIAEEIAEILPDVVLYDSEGKPDSVSYGRITAVLIEAIKDLKKELNELKNNG
jgi:hypothetical protein